MLPRNLQFSKCPHREDNIFVQTWRRWVIMTGGAIETLFEGFSLSKQETVISRSLWWNNPPYGSPESWSINSWFYEVPVLESEKQDNPCLGFYTDLTRKQKEPVATPSLGRNSHFIFGGVLLSANPLKHFQKLAVVSFVNHASPEDWRQQVLAVPKSSTPWPHP